MANGVNLKELLDPKKECDLKALSFEQAIKLLDELVTSVESGDLPLERAMLCYEKGVVLVGHLRGLLSGAEEKLKVLQKP